MTPKSARSAPTWFLAKVAFAAVLIFPARLAFTQAPPQAGSSTRVATVTNAADATVTKTFEVREWLMGINTVVGEDEGKPVVYTKALTSEEAPFYFGAILDNGMLCELSGLKIVQPVRL